MNFILEGSFFNVLIGGFAALFGIYFVQVILTFFGVYTIVNEGFSRVFTIFGNVEASIQEPGLHFLWTHMGWKSLLVGLFGKSYDVDMRRSQHYLRSLGVNSEEGAPMGIGVWYEMKVTHPVKYLFENADPEGSLKASVSNATIRCLGNLPLLRLLTERHTMSHLVRQDVAIEANQWGFTTGSVYIRKVHFKDFDMMKQIENKVVNRLRQVTSSLHQDGLNRVNIITNTAQKQAAVEFARSQGIRIQTLGKALAEIGANPVVADALVRVIEIQKLTESSSAIHFIDSNRSLESQIFTANVLK